MSQNGWAINETGMILKHDLSNYHPIYWEITKKMGTNQPHYLTEKPISMWVEFPLVFFECFFLCLRLECFWACCFYVSLSMLAFLSFGSSTLLGLRSLLCQTSGSPGTHIIHYRTSSCKQVRSKTYCSKTGQRSESMKLNQAGAIRHQAKVYKRLHGSNLHSKGHVGLIAHME